MPGFPCYCAGSLGGYNATLQHVPSLPTYGLAALSHADPPDSLGEVPLCCVSYTEYRFLQAPTVGP